MAAGKRNRGTIFLENATVLHTTAHAGRQWIVRLRAPSCASHALPGTFVHLTCDSSLPMRRPLSIMRVDTGAGWIEVLFKIVGEGLRALAERRPGELVSVLGPIGRPFRPTAARPRPLLIGGGVGIPPMIFLAERLAVDDSADWRPLVLMGSEIPFPFETVTSGTALRGIDSSVDATLALLERIGIAARLASLSDFSGCYKGYVTALAEAWLDAQHSSVRERIEIFACGPTPMLKAVAGIARQFDVPCQVSLEEYMACAVGGCAGCAVAVHESNGIEMKRVCVDGPVFDARTIFPAVNQS